MRNGRDLPLTVIIPVYNGQQTIGQCLQHVYASRVADFEVIVVDDRSDDHTAAIAESFPCTLIRSAANGGPAVARNLAAMQASGRILYFLDADILVRPDTFARTLESLENRPGCCAIFGSFEKNTVPQNFVSVYKNFLHHYTHQNSREEASTFCGGFGAIRREVFLEAGGFDPRRRYLEDVELGYRLRRAGHQIWLNKTLEATHLKRYSLGSLIHSDVMGRAIPWTTIMLESRLFRNDLNTQAHNIASVPISFLLPIAMLSGGTRAWSALPLAVIFLILNWGFLAFTQRERGFGFALRAALLCWLGYLYSGAGALIGVWFYLWSSLRDGLRAHAETPQTSVRQTIHTEEAIRVDPLVPSQ